MNLYSAKINDRTSFIEFINLLHEDFIKQPETWENSTLGDFLEAMSRYTEDIDGYYANTNQNINADIPSWQVFADILKGSVVYE